jgi:hypothetical protein
LKGGNLRLASAICSVRISFSTAEVLLIAVDLAVREPLLEGGDGGVGDLLAAVEVDVGQVRAVGRELGDVLEVAGGEVEPYVPPRCQRREFFLSMPFKAANLYLRLYFLYAL